GDEEEDEPGEFLGHERKRMRAKNKTPAFRPVFCAYPKSADEVRLDVVEALLDRDERVAGAAVLLDDEPLAAALFGLGDDPLERQIAGTDFAEHRFVFRGVEGVVLQVDERQAALEFLGPLNVVRSEEHT